MAVHVLVFGAGALGSLVGGLLSRQHEVTLVGRPAHVQAIQQRGLRIAGKTDLIVHPATATAPPEDPNPDLVLLTVKAYDTSRAVEALAGYRKDATFLSLQNGLGNGEILADHVDRVLGGTTAHGVTWVEPGAIYHAGVGDTFLGPLKGLAAEDAEPVARAFRDSGMACTVTAEIQTELWRKALVNACINPLTALLRIRNGGLLESPALRPLVHMVAREGAEVAALHGIGLEEEGVLERVWAIAQGTADNKSSMLQDLEKGKRTEIDAINGALVRLGETKGVATPVNALLTQLIRGQEELAQRSLDGHGPSPPRA